MRIGIDATWARVVASGTGSYTRGLVKALIEHREHEFVLYFQDADALDNELFPLEGPNVHRRVVDGRGQVDRTLNALSRACARDALDVFHSPGYFLPVWPGPKVVTMHDANMFLQWDKWWRPGLRLAWLSLCTQTLLSSRTARAIVTDSQYSAGRLERVLRVSPRRVRVVYPGIDDRYFEPVAKGFTRAGLAMHSYVLWVSVLSPIKNLEAAIRAFAELDDRDLSFVIVGREDGVYYRDVIAPLVARFGIQERVHRIGTVDIEELVALYAGARALVYPSLAEGFGLPPLEAMACGTPVVASNTTSMPEVLRDAALSVDPTSVVALAEALHRISTDATLRSTLSARGRQRAAHFRWRNTATAMLEIYACA